MAITIAKTKKAKKEVVGVSEAVDAYGENWAEINKIAAQIKKLSDKMKPLKEKDKELLSAILETESERGDDEEFTVSGTNYAIDFGKKGSERSITDIKFIQKRMGNEVFYSLAKVNLGDVDKYLTAAEREKCLETTRTTRTPKVRKL